MRVHRPRRPQRQMALPTESTTPDGSPGHSPRLQSVRRVQSQPNLSRPQRTPDRRRTGPYLDNSPIIQDTLGSLGSIEQECIGWGLDDTPTRRGRVWETRRPDTSGWDFEIYEDPPDRASPHPPTPPEPTDPDENKENIYATASDYESDREEPIEEHVQGIDFDRVNEFTQTAFGPMDDTGALRQLFIDQQGRVHRPAPVPTEARLRPNVRVGITEDEEPFDVWESEWIDDLDVGQIRELRQLGMAFTRGVEQRHAHGSQYPLRDSENIQGPTNVFNEARRITEVQRNPGRFRFADQEEDGANRAMGIRRVVRRRPQDDDDEDEDEEM